MCGLFCPSCSAFIGTHEDAERLKYVARALNLAVEDVKCDGCRAERRSVYCRESCKMYACAVQKGIDFCSSCQDYPCQDLKDFQGAYPHRLELWRSLQRIREAGPEKWYAEMLEHYACSSCGTINSAYDLKCRKCGGEPSCAFVAEHKDKIFG